VTDEPCRCGFLSNAADDPDLPIAFGPEVNEYHFQYREKGSRGLSTINIYHCTFCGGAAPKSKRSQFFHAIPAREEARLAEIMAGLATVDAVIRRLGKPSFDMTNGATWKVPGRGGRPPSVQHLRQLRYTNLSKVAEIRITEHEDGRATWRLSGKPLAQRADAGRHPSTGR
jgi:hypothetical protein